MNGVSSKHVEQLGFKRKCLNGHIIQKMERHESRVTVSIRNGRMDVTHEVLCAACAGWPEATPALPV